MSLVAETEITEQNDIQLTENGRQFSLDLAKYIQMQQEHLKGVGRELLILTGTADIHAETVLHLRMMFSCYNTPLLNELRGGDLHGLSKDEFKVSYFLYHILLSLTSSSLRQNITMNIKSERMIS